MLFHMKSHVVAVGSRVIRVLENWVSPKVKLEALRDVLEGFDRTPNPPDL